MSLDHFFETNKSLLLSIADIKELSLYRCISHYWMAGWIYNRRDTAYMTDGAWDYLCARLKNDFSELKNTKHNHWHLIELKNLSSATAMMHTDKKTPEIAKSAALSLCFEITGEDLEGRIKL